MKKRPHFTVLLSNRGWKKALRGLSGGQKGYFMGDPLRYLLHIGLSTRFFKGGRYFLPPTQGSSSGTRELSVFQSSREKSEGTHIPRSIGPGYSKRSGGGKTCIRFHVDNYMPIVKVARMKAVDLWTTLAALQVAHKLHSPATTSFYIQKRKRIDL